MALSASPLRIWAVSDGRAGIEAQGVGLANAVSRKTFAEVETKRVAFKAGLGALPWRLNLFPRAALVDPDQIAPPWPDLWIAAGRATLPLSVAVRRWSGGKTFVVQLQDPRAPSRLFDLVAPPEHDGLSGDNVFPIIGSPHRTTPQRLADDYALFAEPLDALPHPRVAVLVGGKSKAFDLSPERAAAMAAEIARAVETAGGSLLLTFSRRTPDAAKAAMRARLSALPGWLYDGEGANPYFAFLHAADVILVTEDSANMATEAASTGKPVYLLKMDGGSAKFGRLRDGLIRHGAARPFEGVLETWTYPPLRETERLAAEVVRRLAAL